MNVQSFKLCKQRPTKVFSQTSEDIAAVVWNWYMVIGNSKKCNIFTSHIEVVLLAENRDGI